MEFAVESPDLKLMEVLRQLRSEGVPREAVTILYYKQLPRLPELDDYPAAVESIARFRGLESPVVIVYAPDSIKDIPLFCAYSRATSRCVVIYSAYEVMRDACGTFGRLLLDSEQGAAIREAADAGLTASIIRRLGLSIKQVVSRTGRAEWCHDWGAWLVPSEGESDVAAELWLDHLSLVTGETVYSWRADMRGGLQRIGTPTLLTDTLDYEPMGLADCGTCGRVTPHTLLYGVPDACALCEETNGPCADEPLEAYSLATYDDALDVPRELSPDDKRQLPIALVALGRWKRSLQDEQRALLARTVVTASGRVGYRSALVLTGADIAKSERNEELTLDLLARRYYSWSTWLSERLLFEEWRHMVAGALSMWMQRGLIGRKNRGAYYRT